MSITETQQAVAEEMKRINSAWRSGKVDDMEGAIHPDFVMALPGFAGRVEGRDKLIAGYRDFVTNARLHEYHEQDLQVDVAGRTAVVVIAWEMVYERDGATYRASGRDVWVFERHGGSWVAVWRTMLDLQENAA